MGDKQQQFKKKQHKKLRLQLWEVSSILVLAKQKCVKLKKNNNNFFKTKNHLYLTWDVPVLTNPMPMQLYFVNQVWISGKEKKKNAPVNTLV
uniref:Uncharacterized protein n=1 Tax=Anguilla anguilla TaxID=7936 RepID=A0A0E9WU07_ANGAN